MIDNLCEFFKKIGENPSAKIVGLKVSDLLLARRHIEECEECFEIVERLCAENPEPPKLFGEN